MADSQAEEVIQQRTQLITHVRLLEEKSARLITRALDLLVTSQSLETLAVYFPGIDGGDIWDLPNDNYFFEQEIFSNSTMNMHLCIPAALAKMKGVASLEIGYTKDFELVEAIARTLGAKQLVIRTCPEGHTLNLDRDEQKVWRGRGWMLDGALATKTLGVFDDGGAEVRQVTNKSSDLIQHDGRWM